jgi:hypothetical protein
MKSVHELLALRAEEALAAGDDVPSPCMSVCRMDPATGWCEGCLRSLDEIAGWSRLGDEGKRGVWRAIAARLAQRD